MTYDSYGMRWAGNKNNVLNEFALIHLGPEFWALSIWVLRFWEWIIVIWSDSEYESLLDIQMIKTHLFLIVRQFKDKYFEQIRSETK